MIKQTIGFCIEGLESAQMMKEDNGVFQLNMFIDYEALERDRRLQGAMLEVRKEIRI